MMACACCDSSLDPSNPCEGEGHVAVRFPTGVNHVVRKDGEPINDCYEVNVARGMAWRYNVPLTPCTCGGGVSSYVDEGSFSVGRVA